MANKKGSINDLVAIISILFTVAVVALIAFKVSNEFNKKVQSDESITSLDTGGNAAAAMNGMNNLFSGALDQGFILLAFGLAIMALFFATLVVVHPIFFVFYIIILTIIIFVSGAFSNAYQTMAANPAMYDVASQMVYMNYIMTYLPFFIGVVGFILSIVMYKTWQNAQT